MPAKPTLDQSILFSNLDSAERAALHTIVTLREFESGEPIFGEADPAETFYLLLDGLVRVFKTSPQGKEITLHLVHPGHLFAEAAVFSGGGYPASSMAIRKSRVAAIPRAPFLRLVDQHPGVALKIIASLSAWVREFAHKLEDRTLKAVPARVAGFLLDEHRRTARRTFVLQQSKSLVAEQLGTTSESLSRALRGLREDGIIAVEGRRFTVLDANRLQVEAEAQAEGSFRRSGPPDEAFE